MCTYKMAEAIIEAVSNVPVGGTFWVHAARDQGSYHALPFIISSSRT